MIDVPCRWCGSWSKPATNSLGQQSCSTCLALLDDPPTSGRSTASGPTLSDFEAVFASFSGRRSKPTPHPRSFEVHPVHVADVEAAVSRGLWSRGRPDLEGRMRVRGVPEMDRTTMVVRDQYGEVFEVVMLEEKDDGPMGGPDV